MSALPISTTFVRWRKIIQIRHDSPLNSGRVSICKADDSYQFACLTATARGEVDLRRWCSIEQTQNVELSSSIINMEMLVGSTFWKRSMNQAFQTDSRGTALPSALHVCSTAEGEAAPAIRFVFHAVTCSSLPLLVFSEPATEKFFLIAVFWCTLFSINDI